MYMRHENAAWACNTDMHGQAAWSCKKKKKKKCSIDMNENKA
jgi:hypothetical protein